MRKLKYMTAAFAAAIMVLSSSFTALAGLWKQDEVGIWYDYGYDTYAGNGWHWIDRDGDGISEHYFFDENGYLMVNAVTPDGYRVNQNGQRISGGEVQKGTTTANERDALIQAAVVQGMVTHNYYKGLTRYQADEANFMAQLIAKDIMDTPELDTDYKRISAAASYVSDYCSLCEYGADETNYYRSPYGVFVAGVYTCAGSTRALGRVLDYMGYTWQHANENQNSHQWCIVTMDGQLGWADGMAGAAGFGDANDPNTGLASYGYLIY